MIAILLHLYYQDLWEEFKEKILPILSDNVHLYVTVNEENEYTEDIKKFAKQIFIVKNKGSDFGPFVYAWDKIRKHDYEYVLKLHGKKSISDSRSVYGYGDIWRKQLVNAIISNPEKFDTVLSYMRENPDIFMAGSLRWFNTRYTESENTRQYLESLSSIKRVCSHVKSDVHGCFFSGSMFLVKVEYLNLFFDTCDLNILYEEFEDYYTDDGSSFAHGFERVIGYAVETHRGKFLTLEND